MSVHVSVYQHICMYVCLCGYLTPSPLSLPFCPSLALAPLLPRPSLSLPSSFFLFSGVSQEGLDSITERSPLLLGGVDWGMRFVLAAEARMWGMDSPNERFVEIPLGFPFYFFIFRRDSRRLSFFISLFFVEIPVDFLFYFFLSFSSRFW